MAIGGNIIGPRVGIVCVAVAGVNEPGSAAPAIIPLISVRDAPAPICSLSCVKRDI